MSVTQAKADRKAERDKIFDVLAEVDALIGQEKYEEDTATLLVGRLAAIEVSKKAYVENIDFLLNKCKEDPDKLSTYTTEKERVLAAVEEFKQKYQLWGENYQKKLESESESLASGGFDGHKGPPDQPESEDSDEVVKVMIKEIAASMYSQFGWQDEDRIRDAATKQGTLKTKTEVTKHVLSMRNPGVTTSTPHGTMKKEKRRTRVSFPYENPGDFEETIPYRKDVGTMSPIKMKKPKKKKKHKRKVYVVSSSSEDSSSSSSSSESESSSSEEEEMYSLSDTLHGLHDVQGRTTISMRRKKKKKKKKRVGSDKYIQRATLPTFDGTGDFDSWWSTFLALVDESDEPKKIKFLKLKQAVTDEPFDLVKNLPHSSESYKRAKRRIYDNYGGILRQVNRRYTEAQEFKKITDNDFKAYKRLLCLVDQTIGCLENAGRKNEIGPSALNHLIVGKMPVGVVIRYSEWRSEERRPDNLYMLSEFLEQYISRGVTAYETVYGVRTKQPGTKKRVMQTNRRESFQKKDEETFQRKVKKKCLACQEAFHGLGQCESFKKMSPEERYKICSNNRLCYRCLSDQHYSPSCSSDKLCGVNDCRGRHHRLLHSDAYQKKRNERREPSVPAPVHARGEDRKEEASVDETEKKEGEENGPVSSNTYVTRKEYGARQIAMRVLPIRITKPGGMEIVVNALLDDASDTTYINQEVAAYLDLRGELVYGEVEVFGGQKISTETELVEITVQSMDMSYSMTEMAEVTNEALGNMRMVDWTDIQNRWPYLRDIPFERPKKGRIDALIGLNFLDAMRCLKEVSGMKGDPVARLTPLGWCCAGIIDKGEMQNVRKKRTYFTQKETVGHGSDLSAMVEKFWKWEDLPDERLVSAEDKLAEELLERSMTYRDGRYEVGIPWVGGEPPKVSNNYSQAYDRLNQTEKKLLKTREIYDEYIRIFREYIAKGYLEEVPEGYIETEDGIWYLSHFAVVRIDKETSKVRPVYDASASFEGHCLNDYELSGPALQQNLLLVLLRFRLWAVVLGTDISEMYLQILLKERDRDYQRLLIRLDGEEPPRKLRGTRVMFGRKSSPFIALKVSQDNARTHQEEYPEAATTVLQSTYMDDSMDSRPCSAQAIELYHQLRSLWNIAGMKPKKWFSNSEEVMQLIPPEDRAAKMDILTQVQPQGKALGSLWDILQDALIFKVEQETNQISISTKRGVLKKVASVFDPLGLITPFTIRARTYIQEMWIRGLSWDDELPVDIQVKVDKWLEEIPELRNVQVKRCLIRDDNYVKIYVHLFCDASSWSYGSVAYIVTFYEAKEPDVTFVIAKGKVAPVKYISIPRLELQGACTSAKMSEILHQLMAGIRDVEFVYWTDSLDVLIWILSFCRAYKTYIANRISYVQERTKPEEWRYVPTDCNPADFITRGLTAGDLMNTELWYNGPAFIKQEKDQWPEIPDQVHQRDPLERKEGAQCMMFFTSKSTPNYEFIRRLADKFGSWQKTIRFITYVVHFVNCVSKKRQPMLEEKHDVEITLWRMIQMDAWSLDEAQKKYPGLNLFSDEDRIIRHNSRLQRSDVLSWEFRNPVLMPNDHAYVIRIVRGVHERNHVNFSYMWHEVKARFVIPAGRELCKRVVQNCIVCQMSNAKGLEQKMADLPKSRITRGVRVFQECSIDYAGPFMVKMGRGKVQGKRWICLINCMAVRAVHLEPVWGLDADKMIMALERFCNRRGRPKNMYSDNGTNFTKGNDDLKKELRGTDWEKIEEKVGDWEINWRFQPALSPHHGGVHEALIKMTKSALTKIAGNAQLTDEEFLTLLTRVEGCLNRRPLCYVDSNPDSRVLTPADFITQTANVELVPPTRVESRVDYYRERWRLVGRLIQHFWDRWVREWLTTLRARTKWWKIRENINVGDVVMSLEPGTLPGRWPLARVIDVYPGADGLVRSVKLRRNHKEYTRSIARICPLKMMM